MDDRLGSDLCRCQPRDGLDPGTMRCAFGRRRLARHAADVTEALGNVPTTSQAQFDALVSFHYNTGAIRWATLTTKHRKGDYAGASEEFARWNKAGG